MKIAYWTILALFFGSTTLFAQEKLTGVVLGENESPIAYATVTLYDFTGDSILAFTFTDGDGVFAAGLPAIDSFNVIASSLGKKADTLQVAPPYNFPLRLVLVPAVNDLPEITVKTERKAIVENGDTTVYSVNSFKESDDERIEEILRRIPGINVAEDGSINVKGKPLDRILLEGSDLLGKDYQLASKNIRAKDIATIEEIDHYQENIVLRSVNDSEAIVLNLKLKEESKSVFAGDLTPGLGYGDEIKYRGYATVFNVSKKNKAIFIGNVDNVASGFGNNGLGASYNTSTAYDIREDVNDRWRLLGSNTFDYLGLRPEYTNNGRTAYATLRNEANLTPQLTFNVNGVYGSTNNAQRQINEQSFLIDPASFGLREINDWSNQTRYFEPELELSHVSTNQKTAVDVFFKSSGGSFEQVENRSINSNLFGEDRTEEFRNTSTRVLLSHELKSGIVGLLEASAGALQESIDGTLLNSPLPSVLGLEDTISGTPFQQSLQLRKNTGTIKPSLLFRVGESILKWGGSLENRMLNGIQVPTDAEPNVFFPGSGQRVNIERYASLVSYTASLKGASKLRTSFEFGIENYSYRANETVYPYKFRSAYETKRPKGGVLRLSVVQERTAPSDTEHIFLLPYVTSPRTVTLPGISPDLARRTRFSAFWGNKNALKFSSLQFRLRAEQTTNINFQAVTFENNTLVSRLTTGRKQRNATGVIRYDKFISSITSDLTLSYSSTYSVTDYVFDDRDVSIQSWSNNLNLALNGLITRTLRFKGGSRLSLTSIPTLNNSGSVILFNLRSEGELIFSPGRTKYFIGISNALTGVGDRSNNLYATYCGVKKEVKTKHRTIMLNLRVYNLTNQGTFAQIDSDTVFENRSLTPAIGRFFLFSINYGL